MRDVLASEWLKLRSVSSTGWAVGVAASMVLLGAGWAYYVGTVWDGHGAERRAGFRAAAPEQGFLPLLQTALAVMGVLAITAEHATGTISASLTAVPVRRRLLLGKAVVVGATAAAVATATVLATWAVSRAIAGDRTMGFNLAPLAQDLPALLTAALSVTVLALTGLGIGTATRSTAAAIGGVVGLLFIVPGIVAHLPAPWNTRIGSWLLPALLPQIAGERISTRLGEGSLPPLTALVVLVGYAAVALAAAASAVHRGVRS